VPSVSHLPAADALDHPDVRIVVLVPCRNEEGAVGKVVTDFRAALPHATVYVYDNGSSDDTVETARRAGAVVRSEPVVGKGNVVRRMFADIDADIYVMVDGDDTYDASASPNMVRTLVDQNLDMVVAGRVSEVEEAYRRGHVLGNKLFSWWHGTLFRSQFGDVFSGYRVLSRRLVKSFPTTAAGFEIEAELSIHAVDIKAPCTEVPTRYRPRGEDSSSKLRTFSDGFRILRRSTLLYKEMHPARFFGAFFLLFAITGMVLAVPVISEFADSGQVPRFPTAILAASLELLAVILLTAGVILDSLARRHREVKRLHYLQHLAPAELLSTGRRRSNRAVTG
jgi:glycosyltransferase involved in cell wall biosynthesis